MNKYTQLFDFEYWSRVVLSASKVASRHDKKEMAGVSNMLQTALSLLSENVGGGYNKTHNEVQQNNVMGRNLSVSAYNGNYSTYNGNSIIYITVNLEENRSKYDM